MDPPAAATHSAKVTPTGTRSVTGSATAPAMDRYFSVTGLCGAGDVHRRLHVHHHGAHGQGNAARRNDAAQDVVHQDELVAGRIGIAERGRLHVAGQLRPQQVDHVVVFFLDADHAPLGADQLHGQADALDHLVDVSPQHLLVFVEQWLALGGIKDDSIGFSGKFDMRGKAGPPGANHPRLGNLFYADHAIGILR